MSSNHRVATLLVLGFTIFIFLASACNNLGKALPTPLEAVQPTATFPAAELPVPTPTSASTPWLGPLLYDEWALQNPTLDWEPVEKRIPVYDVGTEEVHWVSTSEPIYRVLEWSPDGCYATYISGKPKDGGSIHTVHIRTMEDQQILSLPAGPGTPGWVTLHWSPTGEWIAYSLSAEIPESEVYLVRSDGSESRRLTNNDYADALQAWSGDGQQVLYWSIQATSADTTPREDWELVMLDTESMESSKVVHFTRPLDSWTALVITDINTMRPIQLAWPDKPEGVPIVKMFWTSVKRQLKDFVGHSYGRPTERRSPAHMTKSRESGIMWGK